MSSISRRNLIATAASVAAAAAAPRAVFAQAAPAPIPAPAVAPAPAPDGPFKLPPLNYAFNKVTLFYQKDSSFDFHFEDTLGNKLATIKSSAVEEFPNVSSVKTTEITPMIITTIPVIHPLFR